MEVILHNYIISLVRAHAGQNCELCLLSAHGRFMWDTTTKYIILCTCYVFLIIHVGINTKNNSYIFDKGHQRIVKLKYQNLMIKWIGTTYLRYSQWPRSYNNMLSWICEHELARDKQRLTVYNVATSTSIDAAPIETSPPQSFDIPVAPLIITSLYSIIKILPDCYNQQ